MRQIPLTLVLNSLLLYPITLTFMSRFRQGRPLEFLWPFLLILFIGIIIVLLFQLWFAWKDQKEFELKNRVFLYLDQGQAEILPWGENDFAKAYNGSRVLEGDTIWTKKGSRAVLSFFNGSVVRLSSNTRLSLDLIKTNQKDDQIELTFKGGEIWINREEKEEGTLQFLVNTEDLKITSQGTIFAAGKNLVETVRVLKGEVKVEVLEKKNSIERVVEEISVGVGQQIEIDRSELEALRARQPISLLEAVSDLWKATEFFKWNSAQDENPIDYAALMEAEGEEMVEEATEVVEEEGVEQERVEEEMVPEVEEATGEISEVKITGTPQVAITVPAESPYSLEKDRIYLEGTAENAQKIIVTSYDKEDKGEPYTLTRYIPGSASWNYLAFFEYGNLKEGENRYTVIAVNSLGEESEPKEVVIVVPEGIIIKAEEPLTKPEIVTLGGEPLPENGVYSTTSDYLKIIGSVSQSTVKVVVNDFNLTLYVPGSTTWTYYAAEKFGNLAVGENVYQVYAEDKEGNQSEVLTFTIIREGPKEESVEEEEGGENREVVKEESEE